MNNNNPIPIKASEPEKTTHHAPGPPVVVHVADEHGVEGVQVPAEHGELVQDEQLGLLGVPLAVGLQQLLLAHHLHRLLLQLVQRGQEVALQQVGPRLADDGLHVD